jgi:hypothetical protein
MPTPSPKGDLRLLCESLQACSSLLGFAKVKWGKNKLIEQASPPQVVIFPVAAANGPADDRTVTVTSSWMLLTAHFWTAPSAQDPGGVDNAFDLRQRWFQALRAQADAGGYYWKSAEGDSERWDIQPDSAEQGQEFEIDIVVRIDANLPTQSTGKVQATSLARVATLEASLGTTDVTATVDATYEYPSSGVLHIDNEQIHYSGVTGTTFTGLTRGYNGTTAATHSSGTAVYITAT